MRELKKDLWPYRVRVNEDQFSVSITDMELWLGEQLGTFKGRWNIVYQYNRTDFYFKDGKDATLFSLKFA